MMKTINVSLFKLFVKPIGVEAVVSNEKKNHDLWQREGKNQLCSSMKREGCISKNDKEMKVWNSLAIKVSVGGRKRVR